jgi:MFS family permease
MGAVDFVVVNEVVAVTPRRVPRHLTLVVLATGVLAFSLLQSLVIPVLPTIQEALDTNQADVTWVLTSYLLSASVFTPIIGRLGDMTGKKRMLVVALGSLALGCLISALASSLAVMILGRAIQGIGGGVLPLAFGIARDEFPDEKVPSAISAIASMGAAGAGVGLVVAGPIVDLLGHDALFWVPLILLLIAGGAAHFVIPESPVTTPGRINWLAAGLLTGALVALLLPVSRGAVWGWTSLTVLTLLAAALALAVLWVVVETRAQFPLIDMRMMRRRAVWTVNLTTLLVGVAMFASFAFVAQFLQTPESAGYGFGASITESGILVLPQTVAAFVVGLVAGRLGQRYGSKNVLLVSIVIAAIGYLGFSFVHDERWQVYLLTTVMGLGIGGVFATTPNLIMAAAPPEQTGTANGMNANIRTIGGSIGAALMATVVTAHVGPTGLPAESGYTTGFLMLTGALGLSGAAALLIPAVRRDAVTHDEPDVPLRHPAAAMIAGGTVSGDAYE